MAEEQINARILRLQKTLVDNGLAAWVMPTADPHMSEYLTEHWQTRAYFSGFTGSAGTLVVTVKDALLWTDGRYWEQAEQQLRGTLVKLAPEVRMQIGPWQWLIGVLELKQTIAVDPAVISYAEYLALQQLLKEKQITLYFNAQLIDAVWPDRPVLPKFSIYRHNPQMVSLSAREKLSYIREKMRQQKNDAHLLSSLDDIAWLTNLRGSDVQFNPVFLAHILIEEHQAFLFVDHAKLDVSLHDYLTEQGFSLQPYEYISQFLANRSIRRLLLQANKVAYATIRQLSAQTQVVNAISPSTLFKSRKDKQELDHIREAMRQDGIALCEFFAWLDEMVIAQKRISELDIAEELANWRAKQRHFVSLSFPTIAGFNTNSAMAHYVATSQSYAWIEGDGLLLIDSGAQYQNGTTDITRVVAINQVTKMQRRDYTLVMKAHINMASLVYPQGISMPLLDIMARAPLWQEHLDYNHGTGHGVGYFLNVHEGPQILSYHAARLSGTEVCPGMVTSIEPGLYRSNQWGVRLENLAASVPHQKTATLLENQQFLQFEILTLCPFDRRLLDIRLLDDREKNWINVYHAWVKRTLSSQLSARAKAWLHQACSAL